jgi:hypothetical protein
MKKIVIVSSGASETRASLGSTVFETVMIMPDSSWRIGSLIVCPLTSSALGRSSLGASRFSSATKSSAGMIASIVGVTDWFFFASAERVLARSA